MEGKDLKMTLGEWMNYKISLSEIIINCSPQDGSDSMLSFPIGVSVWNKLEYVDELNTLISCNKSLINSKLYNLSINTNTDRKRRGNWGGGNQEVRRETIMQNLAANSFKTTTNGHRFFDDITRSKFVFSPEGNGIDTHRTYEALIFKAIPICEHNDKIKEKYKGLPVIYTKDYKEFTSEYLEKKYLEMKDTVYDFSRLFLSFYSEQIKEEIINNGNYWVNRYPQHFGTNVAYPLDLSAFKTTKNIYNELSFITVTNSAYVNMTLNCIKSLNMLNIKITLKVFCLDQNAFELLKSKHDQVFLYEDYFNGETRYADNKWNEFTTKKLDIMHSELEKNDFVIFTDGDIVFEDPYFIIDCYREMIRNPKLELYVQDEHPINGICSGFYIIRKTQNTLNNFSNQILKERDAYSNNDQEYINDLIKKKQIVSKRLPKEQYCNGRYYYEILSKKEKKEYNNYLIHFNWLRGGESKRNKMVEYKKWYMGNLKHN